MTVRHWSCEDYNTRCCCLTCSCGTPRLYPSALWHHEHPLTSDPSCDLALARWHHFLTSAGARRGRLCGEEEQDLQYLCEEHTDRTEVSGTELTCSTHRAADPAPPQTPCTQNNSPCVLSVKNTEQLVRIPQNKVWPKMLHILKFQDVIACSCF